jgi:hypothetical protein
MKNDIDHNAVYSHPAFAGVALRIHGYPKIWVPDIFLMTDEDGNEYEDEDPSEGEWEDDLGSDRILVRMVGDDSKHSVYVSDLTEISEDDYCNECGAIGCGHSSKREA